MHKPKYRQFLSESLMIVLSVLIALFANECRNTVIENRETKNMLANIRLEIVENKGALGKEMDRHKLIMNNIDSIFHVDGNYEALWENGQFNSKEIAPSGFFQEIIRDVAWEVAVQNNITSRVDFSTATVLYEAYTHQRFVLQSVNEMLNILYQREMYDKEKLNETVNLLRITVREFRGRERKLLILYENALEQLSINK